MIRRKIALVSTSLITVLLISAQLMGSSPAPAGNAPRNLRVTGVTDWTVGLRWDAPGGKAPASYVIQSSTGATMTVPGNQTSATFSNGFDYNRTYSFRAFAISSGGSWSSASNQVTATLLKDVTPPTKPIVSANATGPTHIDLTWSTVENSPNQRFDIFVNDVLWARQVAGTSKRINFLQPTTTYTFKVQARDGAGNPSPISDPFSATTTAADPNDHQAPATPPSFGAWRFDETETFVFWSSTTDNVTPNELIQYHVYLNGNFEGAVMEPSALQFIIYLTPGVLNTIELVAVDEAGNRSAPATAVIDLR